jgi:hypothetical protein
MGFGTRSPIITCMKTMKMKDEKINLSINLNIKHKNQDKTIRG